MILHDTTMCRGDNCPQQHLCYRNTAEIEGRQDYFPTIPFDFEQNTCAFFWQDVQRFEQIKLCAYEIYLEERRPRGKDLEHWFKAEEECKAIWNQ